MTSPPLTLVKYFRPEVCSSLTLSLSHSAMTAMKIRVGAAPPPRAPPLFLELWCRTLIILASFLSLVLSSVAVCDGHWLLAGRRLFGLWHFCWAGQQGASANCTRRLGEAGVGGLLEGMGACRCLVTLGVVSAVFGLELLVMSQVSEGRDSSRRWSLGAWLVLLAGWMGAVGVALFVMLLGSFASLSGFTLTFWCQSTATFLFFLNGLAARHIQRIRPSPGVAPHPDKLQAL